MKLQNHDLSAFINELAAQSGKHTDKETAHILTLEAGWYIHFIKRRFSFLGEGGT
jgi:hypothetical protein